MSPQCVLPLLVSQGYSAFPVTHAISWQMSMTLSQTPHHLYIVYILQTVCVSVLHDSVLHIPVPCISTSLVSVIQYPVLRVPVAQPPVTQVRVYPSLVVLIHGLCSLVALVPVPCQGKVTSQSMPPRNSFLPSLP